MQGGREGGLPPRRRTRRRKRIAAGCLAQGQHAGGNTGGSGHTRVGIAKLQFVQQVVPSVTWHEVQQEKMASDHARLAAGIGPGQRNDDIGGCHKLGHPVGETERRDQGCALG